MTSDLPYMDNGTLGKGDVPSTKPFGQFFSSLEVVFDVMKLYDEPIYTYDIPM